MSECPHKETNFKCMCVDVCVCVANGATLWPSAV